MKKVCNAKLNIKNIGEVVELYGWASKIRKLGNLIFIDLRDRSGIVQLVINSDNANYEKALEIKNEYVLKVTGTIVKRSNPNTEIPSGEIEIDVADLEILNVSMTLPFDIKSDNVSEELRLKYRYLDLRKEDLQKYLMTRHKITQSVRKYLDDLGFIEVETPILTATSPEGARDYLVPSRIQNGMFYALPQSPQLFKQLLMVAGFEKYYQIARCFRDEDLRADRQPEFTQIDIEMSFVNEEDVFATVEGMFKEIMKNVKNIDLEIPFRRMTFNDAMNNYGTDKPDTRFDMLINDITSILSENKLSLLQEEFVGAIVAKKSEAMFSRKKVDELSVELNNYKIKNLFFLKHNNEFTGNIANSLSETEKENIKNTLGMENGDIVFIVAGDKKKVLQALGALRISVAKYLNIVPKDKFNFLWITDFPMFEWNEEENRYVSAHHPFTMPKDVDALDDPENCYARSYDIVLNGYELASGSIRIHDKNIQSKVFEKLGISDEEAQRKFGYLLEAFKYGAPPHGGIAPGLDRITMILCGTENIKDVVAFPKTQSASCLMTNAPSKANDKQLKELGIKF